MDDADQTDIQTHVAVEDVAVLVCHHPLQLVPVQSLDTASRDPDHGVGGLVARRERIDRVVLDEVDRWHGYTGGDRHLLDDVEHATLVRVRSVGIDEPATE